jgi:hypothetical protein
MNSSDRDSSVVLASKKALTTSMVAESGRLKFSAVSEPRCLACIGTKVCAHRHNLTFGSGQLPHCPGGLQVRECECMLVRRVTSGEKRRKRR